MANRPHISLVATPKPTSANTPVLQRRNKFTASIEQQITKISLYREGKRISRESFWVDSSGGVFFQLRYGKQPLELERGKSTIKAAGTGNAAWDDLVEQLEQVKILAIGGGLDESLAACANSVRANFKVAKDKKSARGS